MTILALHNCTKDSQKIWRGEEATCILNRIKDICVEKDRTNTTIVDGDVYINMDLSHIGEYLYFILPEASSSIGFAHITGNRAITLVDSQMREIGCFDISTFNDESCISSIDCENMSFDDWVKISKETKAFLTEKDVYAINECFPVF